MKGAIYVAFNNGYLTDVKLELNAPLTGIQWDWFRGKMPYMEEGMSRMRVGSMEVKLLKPRTVQDKIIGFCVYYKKFRGISYQPKTVEKANLKDVPITKEYLEVFFNSPLSNYSIANYIVRINITKDWAKNGMNPKRYPAYYDAKLDKSLGTSDRELYYKHLRSNGWRQEYHPVSGSKWVEKGLFNQGNEV